MNVTFTSGNLGADPETRTTSNGLVVTNLSLASNERKQVNNEWVDHTEWHRIVVFGKQAEVCSKFLSKGSKVFVQGKLRTRKWQDPKTGQDRWSTEIVADNVEFAGRAQAQPANTMAPPTPTTSSNTWGNDDEIPF
tara:strand:- start:845 stop:1252 length:408 start_codon:yes stop_codon:yes gene_type:complete